MGRAADFDAAAAPRIAPLEDARAPWYARLILALQRRKYGAPLESARLWARLPRAFLFLTLLYRAIDRERSPLEPELRTLVQVRVSQINWCAFCVDLMGASALARGMASAKLAALEEFEGSPLYSAREKAALAWAEAMCGPAQPPAPEAFARLRAHFGEQEIVELTALVAFQGMTSKFNAALGVPPQGFCALPPRR
jgi:AhpD family alkylhydroperoxidase